MLQGLRGFSRAASRQQQSSILHIQQKSSLRSCNGNRNYSNKDQGSQHTAHDPLTPFNKGRQQRRSLFVGIMAGTAVLTIGFYLIEGLNDKKKGKLGDASDKKKVVVVGGGFAGLSFLKDINTSRYEVTLISRDNAFLFTPLLQNLTFGEVNPSAITFPIRSLLQQWNKKKVKIVEGEVVSIDTAKQIVILSDKKAYKYDTLIMSTGSNFGNDDIKGVANHCDFLKTAADGLKIRKKVVDAFEAANHSGLSGKQVDKLLSFVVVGTNPAGIQFAEKLNKYLGELEAIYPKLTGRGKIHIIPTDKENVKNTYDTKINQYYEDVLDNLDHEQCRLVKSHVTEVLSKQIKLDGGESIDYNLCVWFAGYSPVPIIDHIIKKNTKKQNNSRALLTNEWLQVKGFENIYAIGECSTLDQVHLIKKCDEIFDDLDNNGDGTIDEKEFEGLTGKYSRRFPQLEAYASLSHKLFSMGDANQDNVLSRQEFNDLLKKIESSLTSYPSTAQTAYQQGKYLANALNSVLKDSEVKKLFKELDEDKSGYLDYKECKKGFKKLGLSVTKKEMAKWLERVDVNKDKKIDEKEFLSVVLDKQHSGSHGDWKKLTHSRILPFRYKHLGGFEYVGYTSEITERGSRSSSILDGYGAWWLYNSIYSSQFLDWSSKIHMLYSRMGKMVFGRDLITHPSDNKEK